MSHYKLLIEATIQGKEAEAIGVSFVRFGSNCLLGILKVTWCLISFVSSALLLYFDVCHLQNRLPLFLVAWLYLILWARLA